MKIEKQKIVTEKKLVTIGYKCDVCGKEHIGFDYPDDWHYFNAGHQSWGNDSFESIKYFLVCGVDCYAKTLKKLTDELENEIDAKIDDMEYDFAKKLSDKLNVLCT